MRGLALLALLPGLIAAEDGGQDLLRLANDQVVVELAPRLGGRLATLRRPDGENVLSFNAPAAAPDPGPDGPFLPANGGVVWVGPQDEWWTQQEVNPARRAARATWPPDPWLEYGTMAVRERTPTSVTLEGPASPVTGLRLTSTVRLAADGAVVQVIRAENTSQRTVTWDLWPNTRVRAGAQVFAPHDQGSRLRLAHATWDPAKEVPLLSSVSDGLATFDIRAAAADTQVMHSGKLFLWPKEPRLFACAGNDLLVMAARAPVGAVQVSHAPVEVFQLVGGDPVRTILELEFHSACQALPPGAVIETAVAWRVLPLGVGVGDDAGRRAAVLAAEPVAKGLRGLVEDGGKE